MNTTRISNNATQDSFTDIPRLSLKKDLAKEKAIAKLVKAYESYPENQVFILGNRSKIVAKITNITVTKATTPNLSFSDAPDNPFKGFK